MAATNVAIRGQRSLLRQIREALASGGPAQTRLDMVVRTIARSMVAEVCSLYMRRAQGEMELFATDQWRRLVPLTWEVFPAAVSTAIQYASLNFPVDHSWTRYNGLQQLSYFVTVFVAAPVSIVTGLMQSPAIANSLGWLGRLLNRQAMRSK